MSSLKVAVVGKGGVGKTTVASVLARNLFYRGFKVLAIDADPNSNLALALGMSPEEAEKIIPIAENADLIEEKTGVNPSSTSPMFRLSFRVDDIIDRFAVETPSGVNLIVMGEIRTSGQGCMCPANALVRAILRHLLTKRDEAVIVDMEAGVEHFGRGTAEHVDVMLIVTEPSLKSLETVKRIYKLSKEMGIKTIRAIGNKITDPSDEKTVRDFCQVHSIPIFGLIPYDESIRKSDANGVALEAHSKGLNSIQQLSEKILDLVKEPPKQIYREKSAET
ncbi:MAG: AAA family ATPase [Candidatus Bathyarchaeota archaeon]